MSASAQSTTDIETLQCLCKSCQETDTVFTFNITDLVKCCKGCNTYKGINQHQWRKIDDDFFCSAVCFHVFTHKNYIASLEKKIKELEAKQAPAPKPEPKKCEKCQVATSDQYGGFIGAALGRFYCADCYTLREKSNQCVKCNKPKSSGLISKLGGEFYCSDCCDLCIKGDPAPAPKPEPQKCVKCKKTCVSGFTAKSTGNFYCSNCYLIVPQTDYDRRFRAPDTKQCLNCKLPKPNYFIGGGSGGKYCCDCYDLTLKSKTPETVTPAAGYFNPETHVIVPRKELLLHPLFETASFSMEVIASQLHDDKPAVCPPESSGCDSTPAQKPKNHGCYSVCLCKAYPLACPP